MNNGTPYANGQQYNQQMQNAYNPIFGNTSFMVSGTSPSGQLQHSFPQIAYFSIEAIAMQQQFSANMVRSGNTTGALNVSGALTVQDQSTGNTQVLGGYQKGGF
jgi:hypothetical protein